MRLPAARHADEALQLLHRAADLRRCHLGVHHHRRSHRALQATHQRVPGGRAAVGRRARVLSGRESQGHRRHGSGTAGAGDRRRRGHALYVLDVHHGRGVDADGDVPHRRRHRSRPGAGAEPCGAGPAPPARGSTQSRSQHGQGLVQSNPGGEPDLAQRALRLALPAQLRGTEHQGRAGTAAGHGRRAGVRRWRLFHAGVARSAEACGAQSDRRGCRGRDPRAERPGGSRTVGRSALQQRGVSDRAECGRAPHRRAAIPRHHRQDRCRRPGGAPR